MVQRADDVGALPGLGSMLSVAGGILVALFAPVYAVLDLADEKTGPALSLLLLTLTGLAAIIGGVRLRRGGTLPQVLVLGFALACATTGVVIQIRHGLTRPAVLLGALGVALPLFMIAEKGWLRPTPGPTSEPAPSDG